MKRRALKLIPIILIGLIVLAPLTMALSITEGSVNFLREFGDSSGQIRGLSLSIVALAEASGKVNQDLTPKIRELTRELISYQNPDGGWGYFPGSVSNVLDTSYALIALSKAQKYFEGIDDFFTVDDARKSGIQFLLNSRTGNAWGYVSESIPMFYPTVLALWALGENGYSSSNPVVSSAIDTLDDLPMYLDEYTALGLRLIAFKAVGKPVNASEVERVMALLDGNDLSPTQRAILTYAMTLYSEPTFEVVAMIARLDQIKHTGANMIFWADTPKYPISITDTLTPTAYALLAITKLVPPIREVAVNPNEMPCDQLISYQNPDGGWGIYKGSPSNEKATYYALLAVEACYPAPTVVEKALNWTENKFKEDEKVVLNESRLTVGYYYALMTLLHFNRLNESEKEHAVEVIKSVKLDRGKWGIADLGPQPSETAMALSALLALGVEASDPDVVAAKNWLLSISSTGWGLYYQSGLYPMMIDINVLDTITVLKALEPIATKSELESHLQWLISQRTEKGWPYSKEYAGANGTSLLGMPRVDLTVDATLLLLRYGFDYTQQTLEFVKSARDSGLITNDTLETAFAVIYLSSFNKMPMVDLSNVRNALETSTFNVVCPGDRVGDAREIIDYLRETFGYRFDLGPLSLMGEGNAIVLAGFNDVNVSSYNRYMALDVSGNSIELNNSTYPRRNTVLLIPGRTADGVILFVLYDKDSSEIAKLIFKIGYPKYMQGPAVVVHYEDRNGDGKIGLNEVTAKTVG